MSTEFLECIEKCTQERSRRLPDRPVTYNILETAEAVIEFAYQKVSSDPEFKEWMNSNKFNDDDKLESIAAVLMLVMTERRRGMRAQQSLS